MNTLTTGWQKYYDDAVASEKTSPGSVVLGGTTGAAPQGWNTVGAKPSNAKSPNPWRTQNRSHPSKTFVPLADTFQETLRLKELHFCKH
jgi:hypothetical protein